MHHCARCCGTHTTLSISVTLNYWQQMLSAFFYRFAECCYAKCHYAECCGARMMLSDT
jgi:hypothetical protein